MKKLILIILTLSSLLLSQVQENSGAVDLAFGGNETGFNTINIGSIADEAFALAITFQGKFICGGSTGIFPRDFAIAQFNFDGTVDFDFGPGNNGFNILDVGEVDQIRGIAIDSQKRIVCVGFGGLVANVNFTAARFNPDGTVDTNFGGIGTGFNNTFDLGGTLDEPFAMVLDNQERIVCGGFSNANGSNDFAVGRFNADGTIDTTFGITGPGFTILPIAGNDQIRGIAIDSQGRIVCAGFSDGVFAVARFNPDGSVDTSFGGNGTGFNTFGIGIILDEALTMVLDRQERIVCGGFGNVIGAIDFAVVRFNSDGSVDTNFGGSGPGFTLLDLGTTDDEITGIALDTQARIVAAGFTATQFGVTRFEQNGPVDISFGVSGPGFTTLSVGGGSRSNAMVIDSRGGIVCAGGGNALQDFGIARFFEENFEGSPCALALRQKYCSIIG